MVRFWTPAETARRMASWGPQRVLACGTLMRWAAMPRSWGRTPRRATCGSALRSMTTKT
ncbi:unnamed protein product [Symbiodinium necroappetens]|uniref:Uncharacterized protein n=1 Tax=Symbiodinium necroappetens TaxID=1628268 RepID=A0A812Z2J1_9DINO|nr:unnamed protein product [Symbiodinium necroappetens]